MVKPTPPETVTITYDLFDLPTAQHKAGLAGLLLQIESMNNRKIIAPSWTSDVNAPSTKVDVTFNEETTASLFDDLYDAVLVEGAPREKPFFIGKGDAKKERECVRRAPVTKTDKKGIEKTSLGYVYLELIPTLATLRQYLPEEGEWLRLWRDLIWQVIRDSKKKAPYIQRAAAKVQPDGAATGDGAEMEPTESDDDEKGTADGSRWADLVKHEAARKKNTFATGTLSSALLLGAQSRSAEIVAFTGRIDQNVLLHFWPMTSMVFVPRFVDSEGNTNIGRRNKDDKSKHFCLAIPDVADLTGFIADYPQVLAALSAETAVYRPKEALIDLPAEGGISFIEHLARLAPQVADGAATRNSVSGVDYLHLNQDGNIVRCLSTGRVAFNRYLAEDYLDIVGRADAKPPYGNPLFRHGLMLALLEEKSWFQPFGNLFAEWKHSFFVHTAAPSKLSWFWADARKKIQEVIQAMPTDQLPDADDLLMMLIHRLARTYLTERAKRKSGIDPEKFKDGAKIPWDKLPKDFYDSRREVGESLFLEFRSRREQAFIEHFAQTFFATKQYLSEDHYAEIGRALLHRTEDVKTLTLMALSANS